MHSNLGSMFGVATIIGVLACAPRSFGGEVVYTSSTHALDLLDVIKPTMGEQAARAAAATAGWKHTKSHRDPDGGGRYEWFECPRPDRASGIKGLFQGGIPIRLYVADNGKVVTTASVLLGYLSRAKRNEAIAEASKVLGKPVRVSADYDGTILPDGSVESAAWRRHRLHIGDGDGTAAGICSAWIGW